MATRSTISIENLDGTVYTCYCHWDGYISHNGVILQKYYNTREAVEKLLSNGDISVLRSKVSDTPVSFEDKEYTTYYAYRGEALTEARGYTDFDDYEKNHQQEEYSYLFTKDNVWSVLPYGKDWYDLEYVIKTEQYKDPED